MFTPIGSPRKLPYPLYNQETNGNTITPIDFDVGDFVWPDDSGERTLLPLWISLNEWVAVCSATDVGADIAYPEQYIEVIAMLMRQTRYKVPICSLIIDCIASDPDVKQALIDALISSDEFNDYVTNIASQQALAMGERERNLLKPAQCDPDYIFNQTSVLVQLLHDVTEDLFEAIEVGTNALERGAILTSGVPVFGQVVPADELLQFADQLVEEIAEDYMGAYDEALYDSIRCDLFCLVKDDCTLSIDRAIAYYEGKVSEEFPDDPWAALQAIIGFLNVGDFGTDTPVYAMHLLVLALIRQMQSVLGVDFGILGLRITAAGDDPDNDWEVLCEECVEPPPSDCLDFTVAAWNWYAAAGGYGVRDSGGLAGEYYSGDGLYYFQWIWFNNPGSFASIEVKFNQAVTGFELVYNNGANVMYRNTGSIGTSFVADASTITGTVPYPFNNAAAWILRPTSAGYVVPSSLRVVEICLTEA